MKHSSMSSSALRRRKLNRNKYYTDDKFNDELDRLITEREVQKPKVSDKEEIRPIAFETLLEGKQLLS